MKYRYYILNATGSIEADSPKEADEIIRNQVVEITIEPEQIENEEER